MDKYNGPDCYKAVINGAVVDPYKVLLAYKITNPCQQHAIKKLLRAGKGHKSYREDIEEAMETLGRCLDILDEQGE